MANIDFVQLVEDVLIKLGLTEEQRKQVTEDLEQAISVNYLNKLHDRMELGNEITQDTPPTLEAFLEKCKQTLAPDVLRMLYEQAVKEVMNKFVERIVPEK